MSDLDKHVDAYREQFAYQFDNEIILNWYPRRIMMATSSDCSVLELGIGHGYSCDLFSKFYDKYTVIDGSQAVIDHFKSRYPENRADVRPAYFEDFEAGSQFDVIVMGFVLEHVEDPGLILKRYRQMLSPGGRCYVAVPNAESLHRRFGHAAGFLPDMSKLGASDHLLGHRRYYSVETLNAELARAGYEITRREGIFLKPLTTSQLVSLDLPTEIVQGMCEVGVQYPELSAGLLFEARVAT